MRMNPRLTRVQVLEVMRRMMERKPRAPSPQDVQREQNELLMQQYFAKYIQDRAIMPFTDMEGMYGNILE